MKVRCGLPGSQRTANFRNPLPAHTAHLDVTKQSGSRDCRGHQAPLRFCTAACVCESVVVPVRRHCPLVTPNRNGTQTPYPSRAHTHTQSLRTFVPEAFRKGLASILVGTFLHGQSPSLCARRKLERHRKGGEGLLTMCARPPRWMTFWLTFLCLHCRVEYSRTIAHVQWRAKKVHYTLFKIEI